MDSERIPPTIDDNNTSPLSTIITTTTTTTVSLHSITVEVNKIDSLIDLYNEEEQRTNSNQKKIGYLGCVKQVADICLNKENLLNKLLSSTANLNTSPAVETTNGTSNVLSCPNSALIENSHKLLQYGTQKLLSLALPTCQLSSSSYSCNNEKLKPTRHITEKVVHILNTCIERDAKMSRLEASIVTLRFGLQRCAKLWESCADEIWELVRLGDAFLSQSAFFEAGIAYQEATELLLLANISNGRLHEEYDGLCKLAPIGYAHALMGQCKYLECAQMLRLGIHFFPTFPSLPFNPKLFFNDQSSMSFKTVINQLEREIEQVENGQNLSFSELDKLHHFQFVLAFYLHFIEDQMNRSQTLFKKIVDADDTFMHETECFLRPVPVHFPSDRESSLIVSNAENESNSMKISVEDLSLKTLERWTIRMLDPKNGIDVKNRKYRFKTYEKCFVASEVVTWLSKNGNITRTEAVSFVQRIMDRAAIRHVSDSCIQFKDEFMLFEFQPPLLEHCFSPILKQGYLLVSGTVKWNRIYAILYESAIAFFEHRGGKLKYLQRLDKINVMIGLPASAFDRLLQEVKVQKQLEDSYEETADKLPFLRRHSSGTMGLTNLIIGNSNDDNHLFYLTIGFDDTIVLKTEYNQYAGGINERDGWIRSLQNLPYVKITKIA